LQPERPAPAPAAANGFAAWVRNRPKWFWVALVGALCIVGTIWQLFSEPKKYNWQSIYGKPEAERLKMLQQQHPESRLEPNNDQAGDRSSQDARKDTTSGR
jgi:hypothetical protein